MTISDGAASYSLAIACLREKCIRSGSIAPRSGDAIEAKWAKDGPVPDRDLETLKTREAAA